MNRLRLSDTAQRDLAIIFSNSEDKFGIEVADRYRRLVSAALRDLRVDSSRPGVQTPIRGGAAVYHLRHSRFDRYRGKRVARPRHLLAFRTVDGEIVILRVLHDAMDLPAWLQDL